MNSKTTVTFLIITNLVLLGAVGYLAKNRTPHPSSANAGESAETNQAAHAAAPHKVIEVTTTNAPGQKFDWRSVESSDYKEYIANLRAIGCPEETIRDIIQADVNKLFESRKKGLKSAKKFEYWKTGNMFSGIMDEERVKQNQEMAKEKKTLLKELLGTEPEEKADMAGLMNPLQGMLDFLPDDKQSKVMGILQDYQARAMKLMKNGTPDAEDMKSMKNMQKEMDQQLAGALTPEELQDYQLRLSQTSMLMRMQLSAFDPSEQEFKDIFKVRKALDDEFGIAGMGATDKAERDRMAAAKKEGDAKLKEILGDTRYAEYERAQDPDYQKLAKIADRNNLDRAVINQAYEMEKLSREEIKKLRADTAMDSARRDEAIKGINAETQRSLQTALGDKAFTAYTNRARGF
jgi:hypothetical protein